MLVSKKRVFSPYESFDNSAKLEGIRQSFKEIETNLSSVIYRRKNVRSGLIGNEGFFINLGKIGVGKLRASDIKSNISADIEVVNKSKLILNVVSNKIKIKVLNFIKLVRANYQHSIVNVNYSCD